jgi:hypothetical protein
MKSGKELVATSVDERFPVLGVDAPKLVNVVRANLGGRGVNEFLLERLKIPTGGDTKWKVADLSGEEKMVDEIEGIIIHWKNTRVYFSKPFEETGGGELPDCRSPDGITGVGDPGGSCVTCPLAQYGTHAKGRGQACTQKRVLFLVQPESILPTVISLPPTSLQDMEIFFAKLAARAIQYNHALLGLKLVQDSNKGGVKFAKVAPSLKRRLTETEVEGIERYIKGMMPAMHEYQEEE